jgi:hypothetical protein
VPLNKGADNVTLVKERYIASCRYLGTVKAKVLAGAVGLKRSRKKVSTELRTIARNDAVTMGGDTIVEASRVIDGRQSFKVYRCGRVRKY